MRDTAVLDRPIDLPDDLALTPTPASDPVIDPSLFTDTSLLTETLPSDAVDTEEERLSRKPAGPGVLDVVKFEDLPEEVQEKLGELRDAYPMGEEALLEIYTSALERTGADPDTDPDPEKAARITELVVSGELATHLPRSENLETAQLISLAMVHTDLDIPLELIGFSYNAMLEEMAYQFHPPDYTGRLSEVVQLTASLLENNQKLARTDEERFRYSIGEAQEALSKAMYLTERNLSEAMDWTQLTYEEVNFDLGVPDGGWLERGTELVGEYGDEAALAAFLLPGGTTTVVGAALVGGTVLADRGPTTMKDLMERSYRQVEAEGIDPGTEEGLAAGRSVFKDYEKAVEDVETVKEGVAEAGGIPEDVEAVIEYIRRQRYGTDGSGGTDPDLTADAAVSRYKALREAAGEQWEELLAMHEKYKVSAVEVASAYKEAEAEAATPEDKNPALLLLATERKVIDLAKAAVDRKTIAAELSEDPEAEYDASAIAARAVRFGLDAETALRLYKEAGSREQYGEDKDKAYTYLTREQWRELYTASADDGVGDGRYEAALKDRDRLLDTTTELMEAERTRLDAEKAARRTAVETAAPHEVEELVAVMEEFEVSSERIIELYEAKKGEVEEYPTAEQWAAAKATPPAVGEPNPTLEGYQAKRDELIDLVRAELEADASGPAEAEAEAETETE